MIKQIFDNIPERLTETYYGKKILAAYNAYGAKYDFCKFYSCSEGTIHIFYSSMIVDGNVDVDDLKIFVEMLKPMNIEMSSFTTLHIVGGYNKAHRTLFRLKPYETDIEFALVKSDNFTSECYGILADSFENMCDFDNWYVDINHRIRHHVANLYLYDNTTVTQQFNINGYVFLSHIATAENARGKGTARRLLYCLAQKYKSENCEAYLWALDHRKSFYETIGFEPIEEDIIYEMEGR